MLRRLIAVFRRQDPVDRAMDEEMRFHIDMEAKDLQSRGMTREDAERTARARFGGVERYKDEGRDVRRASWMADLAQDLRFARRSLFRNRGFASVSVLTIALAIGASTTIFSVTNAVLLKPLPFPDSDRLFQIWDDLSWVGVPEAWVSSPEVIKLRAETRSFDGLAAVRGGSVALTIPNTEPEQLRTSIVSANFFRVLRRGPMLGRAFTPEEDVPNGPLVAIISFELWRRRFEADSGVIGRPVSMNGKPTTIVGVLPADFHYALQSSLGSPSKVDVYFPLQTNFAEGSRGSHWVGILARVKDDVPVSAAMAELARLSADLDSTQYRKQGFHFKPIAIRDRLVREVRPAIIALMAAVGLLVLIMCANLATLALARASRREREIAVRRALGAGYGRIARQILTETTVVSIAGASVGIMLAWWGTRALIAIAPPGLPRRDEVAMDAMVVLFTLGLAAMVGVAMGLAPLGHGVRRDISSAIRERAGTGGGNRLRGALVAGQIALSLMLLSGTALLAASFARLMRVDGGFESRGVVTMTVVATPGKYPGSVSASFHQRVVDRLKQLPGVVAAGVTTSPPLSSSMDQNGVDFPESKANVGDAQKDRSLIDFGTAGPGYFAAMGIRVVEGREFEARDDSAGTPVTIIDEALAKRYFPNGSAVGKYMRIDGDSERVYVAGVVSSVRMYGLRDAGRPQAYAPDAQVPSRAVTIAIRTKPDPAAVSALLPAARAAFHDIDPTTPIVEIKPMTETVAESLGDTRLVLSLITAFALTALVLAAIGIYGVTSTAVIARSREMGIRMALGAQAGQVLSLMMRRPLTLVTLGVALGLAGVAATAKLLQKLLYDISPTDPATLAVVTVILIGVASVSVFAPARRATAVDPARVLRSD